MKINFWLGPAMAFAGGLVAFAGCGSGGNYSRPPAGSGGAGEVGGAAGGESGGGGVGGSAGVGGDEGRGGAGGLIAGSGGSGAAGAGGLVGSGGAVAGNGGGGTGGLGGGGAGVAGRGGGGGGGGMGIGTGGIGGTGTGGVGGTGTGGSAGGGGAQQILSIDFVGGVVDNSAGGAGGRTVTVMSTPMALTEVAGFKPAANWNGAAGAMSSLTPLLLSDGTSTAASVTWNAPGTATSPGVYSAGLTDAPGDARMMNGYLDPASGTTPSATIAVAGLPAAMATGGYDVYVYFLAALTAGQTRSHKYTIGATTITVSQAGPSPTTFPGYTLATATTGDYVVFKNVTGAAFTLTATAVSGTGNIRRAPINGMQIVSPPGP
jgi:hypothetical protein